MLTYIQKVYFVCLTDDFFPYVIVMISLIINYCQHFVCVNPNSYWSYLDVIILYYFHTNYLLYLEQRTIKFLLKIYKGQGHYKDQCNLQSSTDFMSQ